MEKATTVEQVRKAIGRARDKLRQDTREGSSGLIGFVPTMGALHAGHFSLIDAARRECGFVVVSIFVNPTQFGPNEDYDDYPRPIEQDLAGCDSHGVDLVFVPTVEQMYPDGFSTIVHVSGITETMEGQFRPGHFDGVCTVVAKLFSIVGADVAYFGSKDYQQAMVIKRMVADLNLPVRIVLCPTIRESDGLAISSRNAYLDKHERSQAASLYESLRLAEELINGGERNAKEVIRAVRRHLAEKATLGKIDYVAIVDPETLQAVDIIQGDVIVALAVRFPSARLIDNIRVDVEPLRR